MLINISYELESLFFLMYSMYVCMYVNVSVYVYVLYVFKCIIMDKKIRYARNPIVPCGGNVCVCMYVRMYLYTYVCTYL
jgi:hypothetical protein